MFHQRQRQTQTYQNNRQSNIIGTNNTMYPAQSNNPKLFYIKQQRQSLRIGSDQEDLHSKIEISSFLAWLVLFINSLFASFVPCWLMGDIKSQSFTRNSWRYLTVSCLLIPFVMHEQRNIKNPQDKLINVLTKENLKPIFISTINWCIWLLLLVYSCRWTSMNHAVCLTDLKFLVISLFKFKNKQKFHQFEIGGAMISMIGIGLLLVDSATLPQMGGFGIQKYLTIEPWKRLVFGDGLALMGSFASYYLDRYYQPPKMPQFTFLFIYNIFLTFNLVTFGYFFGGSEFSFNTKYGVFGLFTYQRFVSVFYVSIMLGLTMIMTNILVKQIFSGLIISITARFEVVETSILYHVTGLERVPSGLTCLGYSFIIPGLVFVLGGQWNLTNKENTLHLELSSQQEESKNISKIKFEAEGISSPTPSPIPTKKNMPFLEILQQENTHSVDDEIR